MERHAGTHDISLDELKLKRAMCRKDAAGISCDTQRRWLLEKELYNAVSILLSFDRDIPIIFKRLIHTISQKLFRN